MIKEANASFFYANKTIIITKFVSLKKSNNK